MLRDYLNADVEHEIFRHLPLSACKSILFTSKASNKSMRGHLFTRTEPEFFRHQERWLHKVSLLGLLPAIMQDIQTYYHSHLTGEKPKLSTLLLSAKVFCSSNVLWIKTLNLLDLSARYESFFTYSASPISLTSMLANPRECTDDNIRELKIQFAQASTEQLKKYLATFIKRRVIYFDQKILLACLIPHLSPSDQQCALDILKNDFNGTIKGIFLFNHIQNVDSRLTEHTLSQAIINYLSLVWKKILLLETTTSYAVAEDKLLGKANPLEPILLYLPAAEQKRIFSHYLAQLNSSSATYRQQHRALRITALLAPTMHTFSKRVLLDKLCVLIDGRNEALAPVAFKALSQVAGSFVGHIRDLALAKLLARMPLEPDTHTPAYYSSSLLELSHHISHLSQDQYKLILDHAITLFVVAKAETDAFKIMQSMSDHTSILVLIARNYAKAVTLAFDSWNQLAILLAKRLKHPQEDDALAALLADLFMQLNVLYPLLPLNKQQYLCEFFKANICQNNPKIQLFSIKGLEKFIHHLDADDQLLVIKKIWYLYSHETSYSAQKEALNLLINLTASIKRSTVQIEINRLLKNSPHSYAKSVVKSVIKQHAEFFQQTETTPKTEPYAHSSLNCHT